MYSGVPICCIVFITNMAVKCLGFLLIVFVVLGVCVCLFCSCAACRYMTGAVRVCVPRRIGEELFYALGEGCMIHWLWLNGIGFG